MSLGQANVEIRATLDKLDGDLSRARGKIDGALGNLQKLGKVSLAGVVGGIGAIGAAAGAAAAGVVALASSAEPLVGLQAGFAAVTDRIGSNSETMLSALQDASGGLITNRQLMESFNKAASLVGDDFASVLPDAMSLVQKAAQSTGQDMGFLFDSLVTGVGRVSPMILDNLGIQVSLAEVTEHAAEMFGKSAQELSKQEQQAALTEIVMGKLNDTYGDVPNVEQPFAQARVALSNLKDEIGLTLLNAVGPLAAKLLELAQTVLPVLMDVFNNQIMPVITGVADAFGFFFDDLARGEEPIQAIENLLARLAIAFGGNSETAMAVRDAFRGVVDAVKGVIDAVSPYIDMAMEWISQNVEVKDVLIGLGVAIASVIIPAIAGIIAAVAPVIATFVAVVAIVALVRRAWEENWGGIQEKTRAVLDFIKGIVERVVGGIKSFWETNGDAILSKAKEVWEGARDAIKAAIEKAQEIIERVIGIISDKWEEHGEGIKGAAEEFWNAIKDFIDGVINTIQGIVEDVSNAIRDFWEAHGEELQTLAEGVWEAIETAVDTAFQQIQTLFETFAALFSGDWEGFIEGVQEFWETAWDAMVSVLETLWDSIEPLLTSMWTSLSGWFTGKVTEMATIGSNLITSLADAIETRANNYLKTIAQGVANLLPEWVKEILGIASPSKVFSWIGWQIGLGLAEGIRESIPDVREAVDALLDISGALGSIGGTIMSLFKARISDPLEERLRGLDQGIESGVERINEGLEEMGLGSEWEWGAADPLQRARLLLEAVKRGNHDLANEMRAVMDLENRRRGVAEEYAEAQERILQLERQQQDLALLKAQQDLLNLIRDNNLSTSILDGLELGLDADLGEIMDAMSNAMQELLEQTEEELGISSPSKKFMAIGRQITEGLAVGMARTQHMVSRGMDALVRTPTFAPAMAGNGYGTLIIEVDARGAMDPAAVRRAGKEGAKEALKEAGINADARRRV